MENKKILIYEYQLDVNRINQCISAKKEFTNLDIEIEVQKILKENNINYENEFIEYWEGVQNLGRGSEYHIKVQIYIDSKDEKKAKKLLKGYLNREKKFTALDTNSATSYFSEKYKRRLNRILLVFIMIIIIIVFLNIY